MVPEVLDLSGALSRLGGDEQLYADLVQFLREDCPGLVDELQSGITAGDAPVVQRAAHSLKGLIANCGGVRAAEAAQRIENAGASGDLVDAAHLMEPFRREIDALMQAVGNLKARGNSASSMHAPNDIWLLLKAAFREWQADKVPRLGAALAFYTAFSLAPLLVIAIAIGGTMFGEEAAQRHVSAELRGMFGRSVATAVEEFVANSSQRSEQNRWASLLGIAALIFGGSGVFGQLKDALNLIWEVEPKPDLSWWWVLRERAISFAMVGCIGFLLLVSLIFSAMIGAASDRLTNFFAVPPQALFVIDWTVMLAIITILFAIIYKTLPDAVIAWRHVWIGAFITAILFTLGKTLIGLYLGNTAVASAYGAAGSLAIVMLWTYYSSQIVLFGAELTEEYARFSGCAIVPASYARRVWCPEQGSPPAAEPSSSGTG